MMHSLYVVADAGFGEELLKLYVEEMNDPNSIKTAKRAYQLQNIESSGLKVRSPGRSPNSISQSATINTVSDLFSLVKQYDPQFNPKSVHPALLNPDGTPMVLYHGTDEPFDEFKLSEISSREGSFFFAQNEEDAQAYSGTGAVMPVYVSLRNPIDYDHMPSEIYRSLWEKELSLHLSNDFHIFPVPSDCLRKISGFVMIDRCNGGGRRTWII